MVFNRHKAIRLNNKVFNGYVPIELYYLKVKLAF